MNALEPVPQRALIGTGKERFQIKGESCPDCDGSQEWCYSDAHPTFVEQPGSGPTLAELILHCERHMNDYNLKRLFNKTVMPVASSRADARKLQKYYELRCVSPNWSPGECGPNNHKSINPLALADLFGKETMFHSLVCEGCGREFTARRKTARYHSEGCKQRAKRRRAIAA